MIAIEMKRRMDEVGEPATPPPEVGQATLLRKTTLRPPLPNEIYTEYIFNIFFVYTQAPCMVET